MKWNKEHHIWEYEVGDKVQIKPLSWMIDRVNTICGGCFVNDQMTKLAGKIATIRAISCYGSVVNTEYHLFEEDWCWTSHMLLPYGEKKRKTKVHKATIKALQLYENMRQMGFDEQATHDLVQEFKKNPNLHPNNILRHLMVRRTYESTMYAESFAELMCGQRPNMCRPLDEWELMLNRNYKEQYEME